jgi:two-component system chemotaxis response regulator CheB
MLAHDPDLPVAAAPSLLPGHLVAFGGSAGGIPALTRIVSRLPSDFPIPIVVVQHLSAERKSWLPDLLDYRTSLHCAWARNGERPQPGCIHVAPPGGNLTNTATGTFLSTPGPKPRLGWPSIDGFLFSMATRLGPQAIAVVLSGALYDGARGLWAVRRRGGITIVQDPDTASVADMPRTARDLGRADLTLSLDAISVALEILAEEVSPAGIRPTGAGSEGGTSTERECLAPG